MDKQCSLYQQTNYVFFLLYEPKPLIDMMWSGKCFQQTVNTIDLEHQQRYLLV
jgi:hypothetical protein